MRVDESQLDVWAKQGAETTAKNTADSVKNALAYYTWPEGVYFETYLQGSYKNITNIRGDSDVDVVCQLTAVFKSNTKDFSDDQLRLYNQMYNDATYNWTKFQEDVLLRLSKYFGSENVRVGKKSIKLTGNSSRLPADVTVSMGYRKYSRLVNNYDYKYVEGMIFYVPNENRWVVNFPKVHYENGIDKNSVTKTNGWFKPTVRILKNIRSYLVENRLLDKKTAPSYFIECLTYNIPNSSFGKNYMSTLLELLKFLLSESKRNNMSDFLCQNEQMKLFGTSPEQWNEKDCFEFISKTIDLLGNK